MKVSVYYEGWQLECCGEPFAIGDAVSWDCVKLASPPGADCPPSDYQYEAHSDADCTVSGRVAKIQIVQYEYCKHANGYLHPVAYTLLPASHSRSGGVGGYLIELEAAEESAPA